SREARASRPAARPSGAAPAPAGQRPRSAPRAASRLRRRRPARPQRRKRACPRTFEEASRARTSWAAKRQAHDVTAVVEALHTIHQRAHEEQPATVLTQALFRKRRIHHALLHVESLTLVANLQH